MMPPGPPPAGPPPPPDPTSAGPLPDVAPGAPPQTGPAPPILPPAPPDAATQPPSPTVPPDAKLVDAPDMTKSSNPFERQAALIVQQANDQAARLAANIGEHPTGTNPADPSVIQEMWHFSPFGQAAPQEFWRQHDQLLQLAMQHNDPDPYAVAERGALESTYPYRSKIALLDQLNPEQAVARAEQLLAISHRETAKGNTPDALPSTTGPAGLPPPEPTQQGQPS